MKRNRKRSYGFWKPLVFSVTILSCPGSEETPWTLRRPLSPTTPGVLGWGRVAVGSRGLSSRDAAVARGSISCDRFVLGRPYPGSEEGHDKGRV